jgi:hypothetical protein
MGYPRVASGSLTYRFDPNSPIVTETGDVWHHLIDVDWDDSFIRFRPESWRASQSTIIELGQKEVEAYLKSAQVTGHRNYYSTEGEVRTALLVDEAYPRYSPAALRLIQREHATLSNLFSKWMMRVHQIPVVQERRQIDATFEAHGRKYLVEFKVAYHGNTKRAIREALGQIFEYNYYPPRSRRDHWLLILNSMPSDDDKLFLSLLREAFDIPLLVGWRSERDFRFEPPLPFA